MCYYYLYNSFFFLAWNYNPKIINGEDAKEGEIPYQVSYFICNRYCNRYYKKRKVNLKSRRERLQMIFVKKRKARIYHLSSWITRIIFFIFRYHFRRNLALSIFAVDLFLMKIMWLRLLIAYRSKSIKDIFFKTIF